MKIKLIYPILIFLIIACEFILPWWFGFTICIALGYLGPKRSYSSFVLGFVVMFGVWLMATIFFHLVSNNTLSDAIATLLHLPNKYLLFLISAILAGIIGGLSSQIGFYCSQLQKGVK